MKFDYSNIGSSLLYRYVSYLERRKRRWITGTAEWFETEDKYNSATGELSLRMIGYDI